MKIRNFGYKSLTELRDKLAERGIGSHLGDGAAEVVGGDQLSTGELPTGITLSVEELGELIGSGGAGQAPVQAEAEEGSWAWEEDDEEDEEEWSEDDDEEEVSS